MRSGAGMGSRRVRIKGMKRGGISGELRTPPSKSYTHRALVVGSLGAATVLKDCLMSDDTLATLKACKAFGAAIEEEGSGDIVRITGVNGGPSTPDHIINAMNSGTTLRFMVGVAALCSGNTTLTGDESLQSRPNDVMLKVLGDMGARAISETKDGRAPLTIHGPIKPGKVSIEGGVSSQFISSMLMTCPLLNGDSEIKIDGKLRSRPYVDMTLEIMHHAGVEVGENEGGFVISGKQHYGLGNYTIPGDFSSASYPLAAAALTGGRVRLINLKETAQGDSRIIDILRDMGAEVNWDKENDTVEVQGKELKGITIDMNSNPDLVPTVAVLAAYAEGDTVIENVGHLRYKETDRLSTITSELTRMNVKIDEHSDSLTIHGTPGQIKGATVSSHGDHRIAMALTVAALGTEDDVIIEGSDCASVSYPGFYEEMQKIGADIEIL